MKNNVATLKYFNHSNIKSTDGTTGHFLYGELNGFLFIKGHRGCDHLLAGFISTYVTSTYHHYSCKCDSFPW